MALSFGTDVISNRPNAGMFWKPSTYYFAAEDSLSWTYGFFDWSPDGEIAIYSDRSINATWACKSWFVSSGGNGTTHDLTVLNDTNGRTFNVSVPAIGGSDQTTFFTAPEATCGPGCGIVEAFEASVQRSWYYRCNITVGIVQNGTLPQHEVGINLRRMASQGIALQGYGASPTLPGSKQHQVYPSESTYGQPQDGDEGGMGYLIGQFAIGVVGRLSNIPTTQTSICCVQWKP
jgi:hypothetical protein